MSRGLRFPRSSLHQRHVCIIAHLLAVMSQRSRKQGSHSSFRSENDKVWVILHVCQTALRRPGLQPNVLYCTTLHPAILHVCSSRHPTYYVVVTQFRDLNYLNVFIELPRDLPYCVLPSSPRDLTNCALLSSPRDLTDCVLLSSHRDLTNCVLLSPHRD